MKRSAILSVLALLVGCGFHHDPGPRGGPVVRDDTPPPQTDIPLFIIDRGIGVDLPVYSYAVTTNGEDWTLAWRGDEAFADFSGEIIAAGQISDVTFSNGFAGDEVAQTAADRVEFGATTDGFDTQSITLFAQAQPVRFNLYIDGVAAVGGVVFSSGGAPAVNDAIPFDLTTAAQGLAKKAPALPAAVQHSGGGAAPEAARAGGKLPEAGVHIAAPPPRS